MALPIASLHDNGDFTRRFQEKQDEIAKDAANVKLGLSEHLGELIQMQSAEITRLKRIIHDATVLPERHAVAVAIGSVADERGYLKHVMLATASDRSMWILENYSSRAAPGLIKWQRIPQLPQAPDEASADR